MSEKSGYSLGNVVLDLFHRTHLSLSKSLLHLIQLISRLEDRGWKCPIYLHAKSQEPVLFLVFLFPNNYNFLKRSSHFRQIWMKKTWRFFFYSQLDFMRNKGILLIICCQIQLWALNWLSLKGIIKKSGKRLLWTGNQSRTKIHSSFQKTLEFKIWTCVWGKMRKIKRSQKNIHW